jgi:hypothetical protein
MFCCEKQCSSVENCTVQLLDVAAEQRVRGSKGSVVGVEILGPVTFTCSQVAAELTRMLL